MKVRSIILLVEQNFQMALSILSRGAVLGTGKVVLISSVSAVIDNKQVKRRYIGM